MTLVELEVHPLTAQAFAAFGQVVSVHERDPILINDGNTQRFDSLAMIQCADAADRAVINIFRAQPRELPLRVMMLERHPLGSQSFHPLSGEPYLVLVANAVAQPKPSDLHLFLAGPDQGVNYAQNTWHHPLLGLNQVCDFLVVDRKGPGQNCEEFYFDEHCQIQISSISPQVQAQLRTQTRLNTAARG